MSLCSVRFEKNTRFGLDIVVNLQQILQRYCAVLNELCIADSDTVVNKL